MGLLCRHRTLRHTLYIFFMPWALAWSSSSVAFEPNIVTKKRAHIQKRRHTRAVITATEPGCDGYCHNMHSLIPYFHKMTKSFFTTTECLHIFRTIYFFEFVFIFVLNYHILKNYLYNHFVLCPRSISFRSPHTHTTDRFFFFDFHSVMYYIKTVSLWSTFEQFARVQRVYNRSVYVRNTKLELIWKIYSFMKLNFFNDNP